MNKKLTIIALAISVIVLQFCNMPEDKTTDVSQWRGENRDGIYNETNLLDEWPEDGPELLWKYEELGAGYSSVVIADDKVFTLGTIDSVNILFAFDKEGELLWKKELGKAWMKTFPGVRSTPLIYDDKGYVFDGLGVMFCFDLDGNIIWKRNLIEEVSGTNNQHGVHENLIIDGNKLLCTLGEKESNVLALDKNTGETIWISKGLGELNAYCSPNIIEHAGRKFYITMTSSSILSFDIENGELMWSKLLFESSNGIHANVPIYKDGLLFIVKGYGLGSNMYKLAENGSDAELLWTTDSVDIQMGDVLVTGDEIIASSNKNKKWFSLDWNTGNVNYSTKTISEGTIISADNKLFIQTYKGLIAMVVVENNDFTILGKLNAPGKKGDHFTQPVIKDGILYVRYMDTICAYAIKKKS